MCPWAEHTALDGTTLKSTEASVVNKAPNTSAAAHIQAVQAQNPTCIERQKPCSLPISVSKCGPTKLQLDETYIKPIRHWLVRCREETSHSKCQPLAMQWPTYCGVQFRVIDVFRRCITVAPENCQYMALSYVWGAVDQPKLTVDILDELAEEGGLDTIWPKMPQTVRDAVTFCESLGEQCLWIDALCILQDSPRDMRLSILRMRQIYAAAKCTLSAISASTASTGLSGSFTPDAWTCPTVDALYRVIETSPWSRRAWCYQEKVLSHRMIFFTSCGLYMQCQSGVYSATGALLSRETGHPELDRYNTVGGMLSMTTGDGDGLRSYLSAVEHYSSRTTAKSTDKINAFQGILQMYKGMIDGIVSTFCFGLPTFAFDLAFCWRAEQHNPELRNHAFPSWSWLGWDQAVIFDQTMAFKKVYTNQIFAPFGESKQIDIFFDQAGPGFWEITKLRKPAGSREDPQGFGFPATMGLFNREPRLTLGASITKLSIAGEPEETSGLNSRYAVSPLSPGGTVQPLGFIWLHTQWRAQQKTPCIMDFIALAGKSDVERPGKWIITMLMCLKVVHDHGFGRMNKYERLQVMDCELGEEAWLNMGGFTTWIYIS